MLENEVWKGNENGDDGGMKRGCERRDLTREEPEREDVR